MKLFASFIVYLIKYILGGNYVKRLLLSIAILITLTACGDEINENISEVMVEDSQQVLDIMDKAIEEGRSLNDLKENEMAVILGYIEQYVSNEDSMSAEEVTLNKETRLVIEEMSKYLNSSKGNEMYEKQKIKVLEAME